MAVHRGRPKEFERASGGLFSPRSNKVNFNKDKQTQTRTAPLGATNSLKVNDQQFFSSQLGGELSRDWGRFVQKLGANCPETGGESSGANCLWGELSDIPYYILQMHTDRIWRHLCFCIPLSWISTECVEQVKNVETKSWKVSLRRRQAPSVNVTYITLPGSQCNTRCHFARKKTKKILAGLGFDKH